MEHDNVFLYTVHHSIDGGPLGKREIIYCTVYSTVLLYRFGAFLTPAGLQVSSLEQTEVEVYVSHMI